MKTAKHISLIISLMTSSVLLLSACAADKAVVDAKTRERIKGQKQSKGNSAARSFQISSNPTAVHLVERSSEALEIVRLALQYQTSPDSYVKLVKDVDGLGSTLNFSADVKRYENSTFTFETKAVKSFKATLAPNSADQTLLLSVKNEEPVQQSLVKVGGWEANANFRADDYLILVSRDPSESSVVIIELTMKGEINAFDRSRTSEEFISQVKLVVDLESLATEKVLVKSFEGVTEYVKKSGNNFKTVVRDSDGYEVKFDECIRALGELSIVGSRFTDPMVFTEKQVTISEKRFIGNYATCETRPVVDLSKILGK